MLVGVGLRCANPTYKLSLTNGDGIWSQIAEGEATGLHLNGTTGTIDLVGIQSYLVGADSIVG